MLFCSSTPCIRCDLGPLAYIAEIETRQLTIDKQKGYITIFTSIRDIFQYGKDFWRPIVICCVKAKGIFEEVYV